ncbi:MAG: hypothetical protein ACRDPC_15535, partial [Solirubrobacteraceae bacterium]
GGGEAVPGGDEPFGAVPGGDAPFGIVPAGDEPFGAVPAGGEPFEEVVEPEEFDPETVPRRSGPVRGPQGGRRTVKIGGRPGELPTSRSRRPPRTVGERVGPRPDRVAAWAFALGLLLIVIAVATANAAVI